MCELATVQAGLHGNGQTVKSFRSAYDPVERGFEMDLWIYACNSEGYLNCCADGNAWESVSRAFLFFLSKGEESGP